MNDNKRKMAWAETPFAFVAYRVYKESGRWVTGNMPHSAAKSGDAVIAWADAPGCFVAGILDIRKKTGGNCWVLRNAKLIRL